MTGQKTGYLLLLFILPPPRPYFWLWLPVFVIKQIDNLIWLNSAGSDYKDTSCILSGSFNCHDGICVIGDWSLRRIKTPRWCMRREMISESESGQNIMAGTELEKLKLFDFYRNWTMMLILVSAKLDLNIRIRVCGLELGLPLNPFTPFFRGFSFASNSLDPDQILTLTSLYWANILSLPGPLWQHQSNILGLFSEIHKFSTVARAGSESKPPYTRPPHLFIVSARWWVCVGIIIIVF